MCTMKLITGKIDKDEKIINYECFAFVFGNDTMVFEKAYYDVDNNICIYLNYSSDGDVEPIIIKANDTFVSKFSFYFKHFSFDICRAVISNVDCNIEYGIIK